MNGFRNHQKEEGGTCPATEPQLRAQGSDKRVAFFSGNLITEHLVQIQHFQVSAKDNYHFCLQRKV